MDFKQIQELIKLVNKSNLSELTIEEKDFKVTIKQKEEIIQQTLISGQFQQAPQQFAPAPAPAALPAAASAAPPPATKADDTSKYITIKSPMIGTFYRKPSPDKPLFVEVGSEVTPGKVVCIIEAMKLFNEIESEVKGKIVKVLVEDQSPVEYDQPLFLVDPS
ncbi:acetyl-CoA carboxylase biotin carboxyl carrier protein [Lacibacter sediminis]|uniref:Biotin carboxyl carrier protein of acetyl-CoA carboxylase n=1 Tax=Lacibacter sediminis TaxID=2760713 RepID=A0A7G5XCS8_9BACT|nr:acetyl-CoA carboxylase biotin carboxyl carrier protein [Lacibacter sediminis]QNA43281.1 acetyl-CoA carboxylase biotin carboxyl carrier protein [Lacibacter sediminis]